MNYAAMKGSLKRSLTVDRLPNRVNSWRDINFSDDNNKNEINIDFLLDGEGNTTSICHIRTRMGDTSCGCHRVADLKSKASEGI